MSDTKASKMVRVSTPLIPQVQRLCELHRLGYTEALLRGLDNLIDAIETGSASTLPPNDSALIADIVERLERLESSAMTPTVGGGGAEFNEALTKLTHRVERIEKAIAPLTQALAQVEELVKADSAADSGVIAEDTSELEEETDTVNAIATPSPTLPPDLKPPLSQRELSERLGQRHSYYLQKHRVKGKSHFEAWSQSLDPDGIAWTFDEPKKRRGKVPGGKALKFYPKL